MKEAKSSSGRRVSIAPKPKTLLSLSSTGYDNYTAVADLVDNCIDDDVNAKDVFIRKEKSLLSIADNGAGMVEKTLIDALTLGSEGTDTPASTDLGLFGIGLKAATSSMGRAFSVITKHHDDEYLFVLYDLDDIVRRGDFTVEIRPASGSEIERFLRLTRQAQTGTLIEITKLTGITNTNDTQFRNILAKRLGEIFRVFIRGGLCIHVEDKPVPLNDPMTSSAGPTVEWSKEKFEFTAPDDTKVKVEIRLCLMPRPALERDDEITYENQGLYLLRNGRQIQRASWLQLPTRQGKRGPRVKHPQYNRLRGEINISGEHDNYFGVNYTKRGVDVEQWLLDALADKLNPQLNSMADRAKHERHSAESTDQHGEEENRSMDEEINNTAAIRRIPLLKPQEGIERDRVQRKAKPTEHKPPESDDPKRSYPEGTTRRKRAVIKTVNANAGEGGNICYFDNRGNGMLELRWNVAHAFFQEFYNKLPLDKKTIVNMLFLSLGRAIEQDFYQVTEESGELENMARMVRNFHRTMSAELSKLLD